MRAMRLRDLPDHVNEISGHVLDGAIEVHRALGPGLLESAYQRCLIHELRLRGFRVEEDVPLSVEYKGLVVPRAYHVDVLVEGCVVVELKAATAWGPADEAQLMTYVQNLKAPLGILLNFHAPKIMEGGFKRFAMSHPSASPPLRVSAVESTRDDGAKTASSRQRSTPTPSASPSAHVPPSMRAPTSGAASEAE